MAFKNSKRIWVHVVVWAVVLLIPFFLMSTRSSSGDETTGFFSIFTRNMTQSFYVSYVVRAFILALIFYVNYFWLIDRFLFRKKWLWFILVNIGMILLLAKCENYLLAELFPPRHRGGGPPSGVRRKEPPPIWRNIEVIRQLWNYLFYFLGVGVSVAFKTTARWHRDSIKYEQARTKQLEADLRTLRNQLNPHFLFNTLNNIYSLIGTDPTKAQDSVHRLSALLRYVMYNNEQEYVPIDKELEFTQNYIDLMVLRVASAMQLHVQIKNNGSTDPIAPLMFMTLIENAFKHGTANEEKAFIDINIVVESGKGVVCIVENSINTQPTDLEKENKGIGLANLQRRLELLYPDRYEFRTEVRDYTYFAFLRIDF